MVIPNGKHTTKDIGIVLFECLITNHGWSVVLVQVLAIEIVIVIACCRYDIGQAVRNANKLIALLLHFDGIGITIVPNVHNDVLILHRSCTFGVRQSAPKHSLLAVALNEFDIVIGIFTELFYYILLCI